jgi:hypothetical protein
MTRTAVLGLILIGLAGGAARAGGIVIKQSTVTPVGDPQYFYQFDFKLLANTAIVTGDSLTIGSTNPANGAAGVDSNSTFTLPTSQTPAFHSYNFSNAWDVVVGNNMNGVPLGELTWYYFGPTVSTTVDEDLATFGVYTDPLYSNVLTDAQVTQPLNYSTSAHAYVNGTVGSVPLTITGQTTPQLPPMIQGAVPEPATMTLGAIGLGLAGLYRASRRRSPAS